MSGSMETREFAISALPIEAEPYATHDWSSGYAAANHQWVYRFPNGYGASVIKGPYTYGGPEGFYEVAVLTWDGDTSTLTYKTPITNDVLGWQTLEDVAAVLVKIAGLR